MNEASFWKYLRGVLPAEGHYSRTECGDTAPGFPDVHYTLRGGLFEKPISGTIELKDAKNLRAKHPFSGKSGLRRKQIIWIRDELAAGGKVILALQRGRWVYLLRAEFYYECLHQMTLDEITQAALVMWSKGSKDKRRTSDITALLAASS